VRDYRRINTYITSIAYSILDKDDTNDQYFERIVNHNKLKKDKKRKKKSKANVVEKSLKTETLVHDYAELYDIGAIYSDMDAGIPSQNEKKSSDQDES
jgi:hypothetical protein